MAIKDKIISFWKQVKLKSSDMFTLFRVGIGVKVPTNRLHIKDSKDPLKIEGLQNDTTDPDKFLTIDSNYIIKYRTGTEVASDIGAVSSFILEDGDGTEVTITNGSEIKFVEGSGIDIDWTDVSDGSDTDPYDITFTVDHDAATNFVAAEHVDWARASAGTIHSTNIPTLNQDTTGIAATAENVTGRADQDVNIVSDGEVIIKLDADNDESNQKFKVTDRSDTVQFSVQEDGVINIGGGTINIDGSNSNVELNAGSDIILEADNAGGGLASSIQYNSSTGNKIMLGATSDVVVLCNRTLNGTVEIRANAAAGAGGEVTVATFEDDQVTISQLLTAKQRHVMNCGFNVSSSGKKYFPFGYGGTVETAGTTNYGEYIAFTAPCNGYLDYCVLRTEGTPGSTTMALHLASDGTEVPSTTATHTTAAINMSTDDISTKFSFGDTNGAFTAGQVVVIGADFSSACYDTWCTAVLVFDWNNEIS